jgi:hypothetical protein
MERKPWKQDSLWVIMGCDTGVVIRWNDLERGSWKGLSLLERRQITRPETQIEETKKGTG